jgi:hypothetical protein
MVGYRPYPGGDRITDLILSRGRAQAEGAYQSADIWGGVASRIGETFGGALLEQGKQKDEKKKRDALNAQDSAFMRRISNPELPPITPQETLGIYGPERGPAIHKGWAALATPSEKPDLPAILAGYEASDPEMRRIGWPAARPQLLAATGLPEAMVPKEWDEAWYERLKKELKKPEAPIKASPGDTFLDPETMQPLASIPPAPKEPKQHMVTVPGPNGQPIQRLASEEELATGVRAYREPKAPGAKIWVMRDGKPIRINESEYQPGDEPNEKTNITPTMEANVVNRLTKQWDVAVKPVVELDRQVKLMDAGLEAARRGDRAAGAQTVLVTFQKILDPPSVVKESEFARSEAGQALMNRVKGAYEKVRFGGVNMPLDELEKFARLAREAALAQSTGYTGAVKKRLGATADRYKVPHELIFEDYDFQGAFQPPGGGSAPSPAGPSAVEVTATGPGGKKLVLRNGQWVPQ